MSYTEKKPFLNSFSNVKKAQPSEKNWISNELDQNIKHFNELFIENLSQSLSSMLVLKKGTQQEENVKTP